MKRGFVSICGVSPLRLLQINGLLCLILFSTGIKPALGQISATELGLEKEVWISIRTDTQAGSGTLADPWNGSGTRFDERLHELSANNRTNVYLHLLPGVFETQGTLAWNPRSGWKIQGASMLLTTVKLVNVTNNAYGVIAQPANEFLSNIEVSDLTVDCNYSSSNPNFASAVALAGTRHTIRSVRAINAYGIYPISEAFILSIAAGQGDGQGNLIENCEVSNFKGSYCTAISFAGAAPFSDKLIGGIIRGNKVYDLHSSGRFSICIAYGGSAGRGVIFENNTAVRCDVGVNIDTGRSYNVAFRGNQFLECKQFGIGLFGQDLDNYVLENNLIEIDATARSWALNIFDYGGQNKIRNFRIRNNVVRATGGRIGAFGGIAIDVVNGDSCSVTGNRVEEGLRNWFKGPGLVCFDNTDFSGKPLRPYDVNVAGDQVNLPLGERGTLLLNKGNAYIIAQTSSNAISNGANLVAAYARAKAMQPHSQPLSANNRASVLLLPGTYRLADSALVLDTPFVDLVGIGTIAATRVESEGNALVQIADNVRLENLALACTSTTPSAFGSSDRAAYFPADSLSATVIRNCTFSGSNNGLAMRLGITYSGFYEGCTSTARGWGGPGNFSGIAAGCNSGPYSFAAGGLFSGSATNCIAGEGSFGAGGFQGIAMRCTAGQGSFGGAGILIDCDIAGAINASIPTTGKLTDCRIGPAPGNLSTVLVGAGASLYNCTILANPTGTGFSLDASSPVHARVAHCRMNHSIRNVINDIVQPYNVDDPNVD